MEEKFTKKFYMGFITSDRNQMQLLGYSLADFVGDEGLSSGIVKVVGQLDLSELYDYYSNQGGDAYDPEVMLSTWFLAYCEGITSTRKLEELCQRDLHYIYISANLKPDHCSLSRFRQRHLEIFPRLFSQIVVKIHEQGLSRFKYISIDGSKLMANASKRAGKTPARLKAEQEALQKDIREYLDNCDQEDPETEQKLQKAQRRQEKLEEARRFKKSAVRI